MRVLINNVGGGCFGYFSNNDSETIGSIVSKNFFTTVSLTKAFLEFYGKDKKICVVNIGS